MRLSARVGGLDIRGQSPRSDKLSAESASMHVKTSLRFLEDRWDEQVARTLDQPELLRYRSNLLGSDLRITNFGGGNTSSKIRQTSKSTAVRQRRKSFVTSATIRRTRLSPASALAASTIPASRR